MDINPDLIKVSADLAMFVTKNSTQAIRDKIRTIKAKGDSEETINNLVEIINSLIAEKNQLIQIAQTYDEQLITQKISEKDIEYITTNILPLLDKLLENSDEESAEKNRESLEMIKPILSKETFNILQLLGFNFKQAIGEPLTRLVNAAISSNAPTSSEREMEYRLLMEKRQIEYFKILQDEDAYERHLRIIGEG